MWMKIYVDGVHMNPHCFQNLKRFVNNVLNLLIKSNAMRFKGMLMSCYKA